MPNVIDFQAPGKRALSKSPYPERPDPADACSALFKECPSRHATLAPDNLDSAQVSLQLEPCGTSAAVATIFRIW